jgi:DNA-binding transcriptional LysR family regulator
MSLSLEDLRVFRSVAAAGSFGQGAARLRLSQPTVSERMARLERDLGARLFLRGGRGVRLTQAGERLLPYAQRCLALAAEAVAAVRAQDVPAAVRVAMHASFAPSLLPVVMDALAPLGRPINGSDAHSEEIIDRLTDGTVDIGLVVPVVHPSTIAVLPFRTDPMVCVAHPDHPITSRADLNVVDLAGTAIACTAWGPGAERFLTLLHTVPIPAHRLHTVSTAEAAATLARRRSHVGVLPRVTVAADVAAGTLVELPISDLPDWSLTLALAYRAAEASSPPVQALRDSLFAARGGEHKSG